MSEIEILRKPSYAKLRAGEIVFSVSWFISRCSLCGAFPQQLVRARYSFSILRMNPYAFRLKEQRDKEEGNSGYKFWEDPMTTATFNMDLQNLAMEEAWRAQYALDIMEERYHARTHNNQRITTPTQQNLTSCYVKPNAASYTTVIDGWLESKQKGAAQHAQALLDRMEYFYNETGDESIRPNAVTYMLVCQAWAEDRNDFHTGTSALKAEEVLRRMKTRNLSPSFKVYTCILNSWCRQSGQLRGAMRHADQLLTEMESSSEVAHAESHHDDTQHVPMYRSSVESIHPNIITYTDFIGGFARSIEMNSAVKAEGVLQRMRLHEVEPDMVAYTAVINAWAKTNDKKERRIAAPRALALLRRMEEMYADEQYHMKPSKVSYTSCICAIGNSLDKKATPLAEELLRHMYAVNENCTISGVKPTTATFNAVITAFARSQSPDRRRNAQKAESILVEMIKRSKQGELGVDPDVRSWSAVMLAWADSRQPDAAENAQRVLDDFEKLHELGQIRVRPNVVCYTTVMRAWGSSGRDDAFDRAEDILSRLEARYRETRDPDLRPNSWSYVTIISAILRVKPKQNAVEATCRAQEIVCRMMRLHELGIGFYKPNTSVFNALINVWSRSKKKGAAKHAEKILTWMENQYEAGDENVKPDRATFCGVLNAWANHAKRGGAMRAQQLVDHMESLSPVARGFENSIVCYNILIKAWARSGEPDSIDRVERILRRLEQGHEWDPDMVRPDLTTYSSVINCCAYYRGPVEGRNNALGVALKTFNTLRYSEHEQPNHITYGTLFKAIAQLAPYGRNREDMVTSLFEQCRKDGMVDDFVLVQTRNACSAKTFRTLIGNALNKKRKGSGVAVKIDSLPREWTRNVQNS